MEKTSNQLLVICGPTATGKTKLGLDLANKFNGVVISADSRQVYKYMDIGTGKEGKVLGYDLVLPNQEFSVSQYLKYARTKIKEIFASNKLPILVGGSGLYIKAVVDGIETAEIMPNSILRENLKNKSPEDLYSILKNGDPNRAQNMNESDQKNPRRLIRAIEISSQMSHRHVSTSPKNKYNTLFIGLTAPLDVLNHRVRTRVDNRVKAGFEKEVNFLKENGYWESIPKVTLGYREWPDVDKWKNEEFKYVKRQLTWFKKDTRINWFDITDNDFAEKVAKLVEKWHK